MFDKVTQLLGKLGTSRTAKSLYWVFSGNSVAIGLAFVSTIFIARFLSKEQFGLFLAMYSFAALLSDLADIGLGPSLSSFLPPLITEKKVLKVTQILSTAFYIQLGLVIILSVGVLLGSNPIRSLLFAGVGNGELIAALGVMVTLTGFNFAVLALSAQKKFRESAVVNVANSVLRLLLLLIVAVWGKVSILTVLLIHLGGFLLSFVYALVHIKYRFLRLDTSSNDAKRLVKFSGHLGIQKIFVALSSRLDVLMLVPLAGTLEAGVYGAASRIALIFPFFIGSLAQVLAPSFAEFRNGREAKPYLYKSMAVSGSFLLVLGVLFIFAYPIVTLVFGTKYLDAIPVFQALLLALVPFVAATPFTSLIIYTYKKPQFIAFASGIQLLIIISANYVLIPTFGRFGPAWGIGLGNFAVLLISLTASMYYYKKDTK